jgi:hypothetical protein
MAAADLAVATPDRRLRPPHLRRLCLTVSAVTRNDDHAQIAGAPTGTFGSRLYGGDRRIGHLLAGRVADRKR